MTTRRNFLASVAGTAAVAGLAGCLDVFDDAGEDADPKADIYPPEGLETDDQLLSSIADPSFQVPPVFFSGYQYQVSELHERLNLGETVPRLGGDFVTFIDGEIDQIGVSNINQITGSNYHSLSNGGPLGQPAPSGQTIHTTGDFDADPLLAWLKSIDSYQTMGSADGYERYFAEIQDGRGFETWGVRDGRVVIVSRTDVTSRIENYDNHEETANDALALEFDQIEREDAPIANSAPAFADTVQQLDDGPIRAGTAYALIPQGADTGSQAFDEVVNGVVGGGISARVDSDPSLQRVLSYLEPELVSQGRLTAAFEASETDTIPAGTWNVSTDGPTISARATLAEIPDQAMLKTALPVPGYGDLFYRIRPSELGRNPTPRALFAPTVSEDRVQITHDGGDPVEDLQVRYVYDGEVQREPWDGTVEQGDEFMSEETVDSGTQAWVTWRSETKDAAVLVRFRPS